MNMGALMERAWPEINRTSENRLMRSNPGPGLAGIYGECYKCAFCAYEHYSLGCTYCEATYLDAVLLLA